MKINDETVRKKCATSVERSTVNTRMVLPPVSYHQYTCECPLCIHSLAGAVGVCVCVFCTLPSRSQDVVRADLTCTILLRTQLRTHSTTARKTHDTRGSRMTMVKIVRVQGQGQREWARKKSANRLSEKRKWICFGRSVGRRARSHSLAICVHKCDHFFFLLRLVVSACMQEARWWFFRWTMIKRGIFGRFHVKRSPSSYNLEFRAAEIKKNVPFFEYIINGFEWGEHWALNMYGVVAGATLYWCYGEEKTYFSWRR